MSRVDLGLNKDQGLVVIWWWWNIWRRIIERIWVENKVVWILWSKSAILREWWIDKWILEQINSSWNKDTARNIILDNGDSYDDMLDIKWIQGVLSFLKCENIEPVIIDVSNWDINHRLGDDIKISTANKVPLSTVTTSDFKSITWPNYGSEATVMAWQGVVWRIEKEAHLWNKICKIDWVFSWTLWFIMSELSESVLSKAIKKSIEKWYTEPNPMDDLDWLDVAKKLVILARYAWYDVSLEDVEVEWLLDDSYRHFFESWINSELIEKFLEEIRINEDEKYSEMINEAKSNWKVLSYVAKLDNTWDRLILKVWLEVVDKDSDIWNLSWTGNIAIIETNQIDSLEQPSIIIKAPWAWVNTTADGVLRNLHEILLRR